MTKEQEISLMKKRFAMKIENILGGTCYPVFRKIFKEYKTNPRVLIDEFAK